MTDATLWHKRDRSKYGRLKTSEPQDFIFCNKTLCLFTNNWDFLSEVPEIARDNLFITQSQMAVVVACRLINRKFLDSNSIYEISS